MTASNKVVIDTSVLVALVDGRDKWHESAKALRETFKARSAKLVYFDPVLNETFGVLARRANEQRRSHELSGLLDTLTSLVTKEAITWISFQTKRFYDQVVALIRDTSGELNFHDALIALNFRSFGIRTIATFDRDFDQVEWLTRVGTPSEVVAALMTAGSPQIV